MLILCYYQSQCMGFDGTRTYIAPYSFCTSYKKHAIVSLWGIIHTSNNHEYQWHLQVCMGDYTNQNACELFWNNFVQMCKCVRVTSNLLAGEIEMLCPMTTCCICTCICICICLTPHTHTRACTHILERDEGWLKLTCQLVCWRLPNADSSKDLIQHFVV